MKILIRNGSVLHGSGFERRDLAIADARISLSATEPGSGCTVLDASGCLVLPGIVDIHGDAFERQIMPRPGVSFPLKMALLETDRQLAANGITTAYHGVTWSWEPGLRGAENARALLETLETLRGRLAIDARFHLRHEIFNLAAEPEILRWLAEGRIGVLAFNDHMMGVVKTATEKKSKIARMVERTGLSEADFLALVADIWARRDEVSASVERLAAAAASAGIPVLSHDDRDAADRRMYRALGSRIAEFPMTLEAAKDAQAAGEATVFGAPNVIRGGSHTGCPAAEEMVKAGLCTILASDYYYPALAQAAHRLSTNQCLSFADAWALISSNPARALGHDDRGEIAQGKRADLVIAKQHDDHLEILTTIAGGAIAYHADAKPLTKTTYLSGARHRAVA